MNTIEVSDEIIKQIEDIAARCEYTKNSFKNALEFIHIRGNTNGCPYAMVLPSADFEAAFKEYIMNLQKEL